MLLAFASWIILICGRIGGAQAICLLLDYRDYPDVEIRSQVLQVLSRRQYQAKNGERDKICQAINAEIAHATWILAVLIDIGDEEAVHILNNALNNALLQCQARLFWLLSFLYEPQSILRAQKNLTGAVTGASSDEKRAYALEVIDVLVSLELKTMLVPLFDTLSPTERLQRLNTIFPQQPRSCNQRLQEIITGSDAWVNSWTKACALHVIGRLSAIELSETVLSALSSSDPLIRETALRTLFTLDQSLYDRYTDELDEDPSPRVTRTLRQIDMSRKGEKLMLSTLEKVIILRAIDLFSG